MIRKPIIKCKSMQFDSKTSKIETDDEHLFQMIRSDVEHNAKLQRDSVDKLSKARLK